jgi:hypothetical protein
MIELNVKYGIQLDKRSIIDYKIDFELLLVHIIEELKEFLYVMMLLNNKLMNLLKDG